MITSESSQTLHGSVQHLEPPPLVRGALQRNGAIERLSRCGTVDAERFEEAEMSRSLGEVTEFQGYVASVSKTLMGQAYALTGSLEEAQDLTQEALLRTWAHWTRVRTFENPEAWTRRVLHHLAISRWRHQRLADRSARQQPPQVMPEPDPEIVDVVKAIGKLSSNQKRTLVLHDYVGLTVPEIAKEIGVPAGTARSWLHRARRAVAADLAWDADAATGPEGPFREEAVENG
ncbi:MAG TPA: SigE family RNA polymerase sigma factor [Acidimicrobiales bacterium]|nr:SigE family RNA polymerase sigma factor [Acidimicrobiales bacterium]